MVQQLRVHTPNTEGLGSIPGQGTRPHMPQLKIPHATVKMEDPCATTQTQRSYRAGPHSQTPIANKFPENEGTAGLETPGGGPLLLITLA